MESIIIINITEMDWKNKLNNITEKIKGQMHAANVDDCEKLMELMMKYDSNGDGVL